MSNATTDGTKGFQTYFMGSLIEHLGITELLYGGIWNKAVFLEGHRKGEIIAVKRQIDIDSEIAKSKADWHERQAFFKRIKVKTV